MVFSDFPVLWSGCERSRHIHINPLQARFLPIQNKQHILASSCQMRLYEPNRPFIRIYNNNNAPFHKHCRGSITPVSICGSNIQYQFSFWPFSNMTSFPLSACVPFHQHNQHRISQEILNSCGFIEKGPSFINIYLPCLLKASAFYQPHIPSFDPYFHRLPPIW